MPLEANASQEINYPFPRERYEALARDKLRAKAGKLNFKGQSFGLDRERLYFLRNTYIGGCDQVGYKGKGKYIFSHGVVYEGDFLNGMMHGKGILRYPNGVRIEGIWNEDKVQSYTYFYQDGLEKNEKYCRMPDRRFYLELRTGFQPAGKELLTSVQPTQTLPPDCYDYGDSIYDPNMLCFITKGYGVKTALTTIKLERNEDMEMEDSSSSDSIWSESSDKLEIVMNKKLDMWIKRTCRKAGDEPAGYSTRFYEVWNVGTRKEVEAIEECLGQS